MDIREFLLRSYYKVDKTIEIGYRRLGNSYRNCRRDSAHEHRLLDVENKIGKVKCRGTMLTTFAVCMGVIIGIILALLLAQWTYTIILK